MIQLAFHIGIQQAAITLAAAPKNIACAVECVGNVDSLGILAAAYAKASALQLVPAPCMNRGLEKQFAVPQRSLALRQLCG